MKIEISKSKIDVFSEETPKYVQSYLTIKGKRILEIGCDAGGFVYKLMKMGVLLTACDTDEKLILLAKEKGLSAFHIDFLLLKDKLFDVIIFTRSLHHIQNLEKAIAHSKLILAKGGKLIIEDFDLEMINIYTAI